MHAVVLLALALLLPGVVQAERSMPAGRPFAVRLEPQQPMTMVFPERIVSVTVGFDKKTFDTSSNGPYVFLQVNAPQLSGRIFVVDDKGAMYWGTYQTGGQPDDVVYIVRDPPPKERLVPFTAQSLLRALRTNTAVPGQQAPQLPTPTLMDPRLVMRLASTRQVGEHIGMILLVQNTQEVPLGLDKRIGQARQLEAHVVPLDTIVWPPGLVLDVISVGDDVLQPGAETQIYAVLRRP
jgi:hypothetical protein